MLNFLGGAAIFNFSILIVGKVYNLAMNIFENTDKN